MAQVSLTNIAKIGKLRAQANSLRGATANWAEKYSDRKHYDKQGFAFTYREGCGGFSIPALGFEAYVGTYGSSSVSTAWSVDKEIIDAFFLKAINTHKQAIFDTMAVLAEAAATELVSAAQAELEQMQAMLAEVQAPVSEAA